MQNKPSCRLLVIDDTPSIHSDFRKILCVPAAGPSPLDDLAFAVFGTATAAAKPATTTFIVDSAHQGAEGLALVIAAKNAGHPYAVAFVDMRMPPGWDGLETIVQLWAVDPDLQIVICTAHSDHSWSSITQRLGQTDKLLILKKPFDHIEALQIAHSLSKKWEITLRDHARIDQLDDTVAARTRQLIDAEQRFTAAFNASPLALAIQALDDGTVLEVNPAHSRIFGRTAEEVIGRTPEQLGPGLNSARWHSLLAAIARGESLDEVPVEYTRAAGDIRHLRASARPIQAGTRACAVWSIRDITDQIQLEQQFIQSQKMEAIGQLAAGVAHDFNNLLTVILSYSGFILDDEALAPTQREHVAHIRAAGERAAALTRQLLVFSRRQLNTPAPVNFNATLTNLRAMISRLVPERIRVELDCAPDLPIVVADEANIEHIVMNLVVNARDALARDGRIIIGTATVTLDEAQAAARAGTGARPGRFARISVADDGTGIPADVLPKIFDPFFTTKAVGEGTGLGLSTVYAIVQQHKGWIEVDSIVGLGTTFDLYFPVPAIPLSAGTTAPFPGQTAPRRGRGQRILLVEDDHAVRKAAAALVTRAGYHVVATEDGPNALAHWQAAGFKFDLLLSDIVMPNGLSGIDLAARLRADVPGLKVILATGYSDALLNQNLDGLSDTPILQKPYTYAALALALETAFATPLAQPAPKNPA